MIKITEAGIEGTMLLKQLYENRQRRGLGKLIFPFTTYLRALVAERYIQPRERLLDIGCGDGHFIKRSKCKKRYGLDKLLGDEVIDKLNFPDSYFDYVTMLSVLEFMRFPNLIFEEIYRVLKPMGKFVFTTPKGKADFIIRLYVRNIDEQIETYFDNESVRKLAGELFKIVDNQTILFGLDQVYCLQKM